ncbi:MAG: hypothetical protein DWQ40_13075 [Actinobacteria bacterium]|nr:MAG: hypothetical protein DWQ40_13075 [Actinomycetota bacterium]
MFVGNGYRTVSWIVGTGRTVGVLARRPRLLWEAIRAAFSVRAHRGLRPSADYLHWRVHTAYGDHMSQTTSDDLIEFLRWRRMMRVTA